MTHPIFFYFCRGLDFISYKDCFPVLQLQGSWCTGVLHRQHADSAPQRVNRFLWGPSVPFCIWHPSVWCHSASWESQLYSFCCRSKYNSSAQIHKLKLFNFYGWAALSIFLIKCRSPTKQKGQVLWVKWDMVGSLGRNITFIPKFVSELKIWYVFNEMKTKVSSPKWSNFSS